MRTHCHGVKTHGFECAVILLAVMVQVIGGAVIHRVARSADRPTFRPGHFPITLDTLAARAHLGYANSFRPTNGDLIYSPKGMKRCRLTQTYAGYDVYGASVEAELDFGDDLTGHFYGHVIRDLERDIPDPQACKQNLLDMVNLAIINEGFNVFDGNIDIRDVQRIIYMDKETDNAKLAYLVKFFYAGDHNVSFPVYVIDACTTEIIASYNQIENSSVAHLHTEAVQEETVTITESEDETPTNESTCALNVVGVGGNGKLGMMKYNQPPHCLQVTKQGDNCVLKNKYVAVYDNHQTTTREPTDLATFPCPDGYHDAVNGGYGPANDAFRFGIVIGQLFEVQYNMKAYPFKLTVHYGSAFANAFWDGKGMFFGDGSKMFYPLVSQDITAHEIAHGITYRNSQLQYRNQAGGINEAFSDLSGEVAEHFGTGANDWKVLYCLRNDFGLRLIGNDIVKGSGALRYMDDPTKDGRSLKHVDKLRRDTQVHHSSGIFNYAFYLLVEHEKMSIYDAYKCFLVANLLIWDSTTTFEEGACGVVQACEDNGFQWQKVEKVFRAVGIHFKDCNFLALSPVLHVGDTRHNVMISKNSNPMFKLDLTNAPWKVRVKTETDEPTDEPTLIQICISSDSASNDVIAKGHNKVSFRTDNEPSLVYVALSFPSTTDILVDLSVS